MNYFNYFTEIEEEFVKRRGSHLLVSPLDWSLMESWKQRGVPLHIVLRGINSTFDSYDQRARGGRRVNSLFFCRQEVESMFLQYCESRVGAGEEAGENGSRDSGFSLRAVADYLDQQRESLEMLGRRQASDPALAETITRVIARLDQVIDDLRGGVAASPEMLEVDLTMIEEVILDGIRESAGDARLAELKKEAAGQLRAYRQTMEKESYEQTLDNLVARKLREQYQVPRLSLFYM